MAKKVKYTPPEWLEEEAKVYIRTVLRALNQGQNIKDIDLGALNMLAISYSQFIQASRQVAIEGQTFINSKMETVKNPAVNIIKEASAQAMRIAVEFGLTPKSREKIAGCKTGDVDLSPLEEFEKEAKK